jgi:hypothetical protein
MNELFINLCKNQHILQQIYNENKRKYKLNKNREEKSRVKQNVALLKECKNKKENHGFLL